MEANRGDGKEYPANPGYVFTPEAAGVIFKTRQRRMTQPWPSSIDGTTHLLVSLLEEPTMQGRLEEVGIPVNRVQAAVTFIEGGIRPAAGDPENSGFAEHVGRVLRRTRRMVDTTDGRDVPIDTIDLLAGVVSDHYNLAAGILESVTEVSSEEMLKRILETKKLSSSLILDEVNRILFPGRED